MKRSVLKYFAKFTGKHPCQSLFFNKILSLRPATLSKMRPWHKCFPVNFAKFLRIPFLQNTFKESPYLCFVFTSFTFLIEPFCLFYKNEHFTGNWYIFSFDLNTNKTKCYICLKLRLDQIPLISLNKLTEEGSRRCSIKMAFLNILPNSQENTCAWVSFL